MIVLERGDLEMIIVDLVGTEAATEVVIVVVIEADITIETTTERMLQLFALNVGKTRLYRLNRLQAVSQFYVGIVLELVSN